MVSTGIYRDEKYSKIREVGNTCNNRLRPRFSTVPSRLKGMPIVKN